MAASMTHRGPDNEGVLIAGQVGFGHRRLSIIDLSSAGNQPMVNKRNRQFITYNGEIYNYQQLRKQLSETCEFHTSTDTEVLLKAFGQWNVETFNKLDGIFAFAISDPIANRVILARDHFGTKPLYYYIDRDMLLFASELKALVASKMIRLTLSKTALNDYLDFHWIPAPRTIYDEVKKLLPATYMELDISSWEITRSRYWRPSYRPEHGRSDADWAVEAEERIGNAVVSQTVADVPVGTFLSGGIDSSLVTRAAASTKPQPRTFTIDFENTRQSEARFAQDIASILGIQTSIRNLESLSPARIRKVVSQFDEPFADSSMIPTYYVCESASKDVTVCLSGDGGDELFAGYKHHRLAAHLHRLRFAPDCLMSMLFSPLASATPKTFRIAPWLKRLSLSRELRPLTLARIPGRVDRLSLLSSEIRENDASRMSHLDECIDRPIDAPMLTTIQMHDLDFYLPNDMLVKVDTASMSHSLEVRVPFLSRELCEFAFRIPEHQRKEKQVLRQVMRSSFGDDHARRRKQGFAIPISSWMTNLVTETEEERFFRGPLAQSGVLNTRSVKSLFSQQRSSMHSDRSKRRRRINMDRSDDVFALLVLDEWWNTFGTI